MSKDLRDMFEDDNSSGEAKLKLGHEDRFLKRLEKEFPKTKKSTFVYLKVAAAAVLLVGVALYYFNINEMNTKENKVVEKNIPVKQSRVFSLGDLSPDLKKVEDYYVSTINLELSKLELTEANKGLVDSYLEQLESLDDEYNRLNVELNEMGPNDQTISALIENLQLRLQLLQKLRIKLNELKSSKNEQLNIL